MRADTDTLSLVDAMMARGGLNQEPSSWLQRWVVCQNIDARARPSFRLNPKASDGIDPSARATLGERFAASLCTYDIAASARMPPIEDILIIDVNLSERRGRMNIAIFGATGAVGSTLLIHLLKGTDLAPGDHLVLVGRGTTANTGKLLAMKADLLDAFDAGVVTISVCPSIEAMPAVDVFIMAAGATIDEDITLRSQLAARNLPLFHQVAEGLSRQCPEVFVLIISNPIELAVQVFCRYMDRQRVLGMGAQQDSLRFAGAIATHLGLPRAAVRASVLGEHGEGMVPLWSSVYVIDEQEGVTERLEELHAKYADRVSSEVLDTTQAEITALMEKGEIERAYLSLQTVRPDLKILIEPFLTIRLLQSTPNATANATLDCIASIRHSDDRTVHGQVLLEGEFCDLSGVIGVPLALRRSGWRIGSYLPLAAAELIRLREVNRMISETYRPLLQAKEVQAS